MTQSRDHHAASPTDIKGCRAQETRPLLALVLVAAGRGLRAGGDVAKQWRMLGRQRVADWTISALRNGVQLYVDHVDPPAFSRVISIIVLHPDDLASDAIIGSLPDDLEPVAGGATRAQSVRAGLDRAQDHGADYVLIHDIARPCVSPDIIFGVCDALLNGAMAAAPGVPVSDALWRAQGARVVETQDRSGLYGAQTPQGFALPPLIAAHERFDTLHTSPADDVELARAAGIEVTITEGASDNIKITRPEDFDRALAMLRGTMDIRMGNGFDVHAFCDGDHVTLCGVQVAHTHGLLGHSDADVGMHAVTDAIYGALADGDIGQHFPPSDPQWKGAASHIFLRHAVALAASRGFSLSSVDCTLICEMPKIGPHAQAMRAALADIMEIDIGRVSVKATTSEQLGFTGRKEGIAAMASALLVTT